MLEYFDPGMNPNTDYGTPPVASDTVVSLHIDGKAVQVTAGTSIMHAAAKAGIEIPKLCATDRLDAYGSCRLCSVEISGRKGSPASCTTPVIEGMQVRTSSPALATLRKNVMELYLSDHPLDCLTCSANGDCELQTMAARVGIREVRYGFNGKNHSTATADHSNPYFEFNPDKCIACSRCERACGDIQGTFALAMDNRGFDSKISVGPANTMLASDCVSCGACVDVCPTASLIEKSISSHGQADRSVITTCAYCGVGCNFIAEASGEHIIRMRPYKGGKANRGHACVKGRFAFAYATHKDRVTKPLIRDSIDQPWQETSWENAIAFAADKIQLAQKTHGRQSVGAITSSRCTNEETYLLQKLVRTAFANNNTDTCARVCHSPTGYGLKTTLGESAGTQSFDSVAHSDLILLIGANPSDAHPVFASRLKKRLRQGAGLIVADPRRLDFSDAPHITSTQHLALLPGSNVALINALAHVIVKEQLYDQRFINARCHEENFAQWCEFISRENNSPNAAELITGVAAAEIRDAARRYANADNAAIYYGLGVTEHSQGSSMVMGIANLALLCGNIGRQGVGVNPLRGQNNVQGSCDMGSFPHEYPGYQHVADAAVRSRFEQHWQVSLDPDPGLRIPNMFNAALDGDFRVLFCQGEDIAQSDPNTQHVEAALRALDCLIVQDIFLNETSKFAHIVLPGASFLEKDGTFTNAERRINRVRQVIKPLAGKQDWEVTMALSNALGYPMHYQHPSEIMDEIAQLAPTFKGVSYDKIDALGSVQWPCNEANPDGTETMHVNTFPIGKARFAITEFVPSDERSTRRFPLLLTTGRVLSQYNVGAQTRRTDNNIWHGEDVLEIHPSDAETRGIQPNSIVSIRSRVGSTRLRAKLSERMQPGVVYTTFHHPESGANIITTDNSDWATNCPEYKVTAVEVSSCQQQEEHA